MELTTLQANEILNSLDVCIGLLSNLAEKLKQKIEDGNNRQN